jgi:hypothetical protein
MFSLRRAVTVLVVLCAGVASAESNPMESVGEQHNLYLGCLQKVDPDGKSNPLEVLVKNCGFESEQPAEEFIKQYSALMPEDHLAPLSAKLEPYRREFNDRQYAFALEIERILSTQTPEESAKSLAALEAKAVVSLGREKADLAVLSGMSTARFSLAFWQSNSEDPKPRKAKWWQVVLGDVAGGIVGGIFGGGVGAVGLGTACSQAVASLTE